MEIDDVKEGAIEDTEGATENDDPLDGEDDALSPPKGKYFIFYLGLFYP